MRWYHGAQASLKLWIVKDDLELSVLFCHLQVLGLQAQTTMQRGFEWCQRLNPGFHAFSASTLPSAYILSLVFVTVCLLFETGSQYVEQASLELTMQSRLALNPSSFCLSFLSIWITRMHHHTYLQNIFSKFSKINNKKTNLIIKI